MIGGGFNIPRGPGPPPQPATMQTPVNQTPFTNGPTGKEAAADSLRQPLTLPSLRPAVPDDPRFHTQHVASPQGSRIAVVLSNSPGKAVTAAGVTRNDDVDHVMSDLSPQFKKTLAMRMTGTPSGSPQRPTGNTNPDSSSKVEATKSEPPAIPAPTVSRPRGRPKGWRPGMSYAELRGTAPAAAGNRTARQTKPKATPSGPAKRRGRPPKQPSPSPSAVYHGLEPSFLAFLCEWDGCKAELHNLDTLRKHVYVVHGRCRYQQQHHHQQQQQHQICLWGKCARGEQARVFADEQVFKAHVEEAHLVPFGWHTGDGPSNVEGLRPGNRGGGQDAPPLPIPDYLRDAEGNQVTPSVQAQELEDLATWKANRRKLKELLIRRNDNLPDEADESDAGTSDEDTS